MERIFMIFLEFLVWSIGGAVILGLLAYLGAHFNIFFTFVPSGEIKFVIKGKTIHRVIANVPGWVYLPEKDEMVELSTLKSSKHPNLSFLNKTLGIYGVGIYPIYKIATWHFEWDKVHFNTAGGQGYTVEHRDEPVESIFFQYPYLMRTPPAEIDGNLPYNLTMLGDLLSIHPIRMQTKNLPHGYWLTKATGIVLEAGRVYASPRTIKQLQQNLNPTTSDTEDFGTVIMGMVNASGTNPGLPYAVGVRLAGMRLLDVDINDPKGSLREATTAQAVAAQKANAQITEAEGAAKAQRITADADAYAIEIKAKAEGERVKMLVGAAASAPGGVELLQTQAYSDALERGLIGTHAGTVVIGSAPGLMLNAPTAPTGSIVPATKSTP